MSICRCVLVGLLGGMLGLVTLVDAAEPVHETVVYQGVLNDGGAPANGMYDIKFQYFDELGNPFLTTVTYLEYEVIDGLFSLPIDFTNVFGFGERRFLQVSVRPAGTTEFTDLSPRQEVRASPYSVYAIEAGNAQTAVAADSAVVSETSLDNEWSRSGTVLRAGDTNEKLLINPDLTGGLMLSTVTDLQLNFDDSIFGGIYLNSVNSGGTPFYGFAVDSSTRGYIEFEPDLDLMRFFNGGASGASLSLSENSAVVKKLAADGPIVKDFGSDDFHRHGPIAYGVFNTDGSQYSGTPNISATWDGVNDRYLVSVSGVSIHFSDYTAIVNPSGTGLPVISTTSSISGNLAVYMFTLGGTKIQNRFSVVIYENAPVIVD